MKVDPAEVGVIGSVPPDVYTGTDSQRSDLRDCELDKYSRPRLIRISFPAVSFSVFKIARQTDLFCIAEEEVVPFVPSWEKGLFELVGYHRTRAGIRAGPLCCTHNYWSQTCALRRLGSAHFVLAQ